MTTLNKHKIGILGGGQLGKMLIQETSKLGIQTLVLDPSENCSAKPYCHQFVSGHYADYNDVIRIGNMVDILTFEIEHVNVEALMELKEQGKQIFPSPEAIKTIQNKIFQKQFYETHNLPTADFLTFQNRKELLDLIESGKKTFPFVWKSATFGYDGKGVSVIKNQTDAEKVADVPGLIEDKVQIQKEISVIVCRSSTGSIANFPPLSMTFFEAENLIKTVYRDDSIGQEIAQKAEAVARNVAEALDVVGVLAVEMFLDEQNEILINEIAPRPHNSGHLTIEASPISQYAAHIRAFLGGAINPLTIKNHSGMYNLVGDPHHTGTTAYEGLGKVLEQENTFVHLYEKPETKPYRKMGHITVLSDNSSALQEQLRFIEEQVKVVSG